MDIKDMKIGYALTGSFCTIRESLKQMQNLVGNGAKVTPILSYSVSSTDTRFITKAELMSQVEVITGNKPVIDITGAEPIGPKKLMDIIIVAPCTGNSIAKIANGVSDTPVTLACKAHMRNNRPVLLAVSTNDGLGANAVNIGKLINMKNIYLVPFKQDMPAEKPNSLVSDLSLMEKAALSAIEGKQLQPLIL